MKNDKSPVLRMMSSQFGSSISSVSNISPSQPDLMSKNRPENCPSCKATIADMPTERRTGERDKDDITDGQRRKGYVKLLERQQSLSSVKVRSSTMPLPTTTATYYAEINGKVMVMSKSTVAKKNNEAGQLFTDQVPKYPAKHRRRVISIESMV
eukprot:gene16067-17690_t